MYIRIHVYMCTGVCVHEGMRICVHTHMCIRVCVYTYTRLHVYTCTPEMYGLTPYCRDMCTRIHIHTHVRITCMSRHTNTYKYIHTLIYAYTLVIHICKYIYAHLHIHTYQYHMWSTHTRVWPDHDGLVEIHICNVPIQLYQYNIVRDHIVHRS